MGLKISVSAAFGLLVGLGVIYWLDSTVEPGGEGLNLHGQAFVIVVSTAVCTVIGALIAFFGSGGGKKG